MTVGPTHAADTAAKEAVVAEKHHIAALVGKRSHHRLPRTGRAVVLAVGLALLLAGCSSHPEISSWVLVRPDDVTVEFGVDTCNAELDATVIESDERIQVTITARDDTTDDCRDNLVVTLDAPLAGRQIVNGATGEPLEIRRPGG